MPNEGQRNSGDELSPTTDGDAVEPDATAETEGVMDILPPDLEEKPTQPTTVEVRSPRKPSQTKLSQRKEEK